MKFTVKNYKLSKINDYFKNCNFFFLVNTITSKNNIKVAQESKKLDISYYKLYNTLTKRILINSIYYNYQFLINGLVMITIPRSEKSVETRIIEFNTLLGIKVNNKIYSISQLDSNIKFNYNKTFIDLTKTFIVSLKSIKIFNIN